MSLSNQLSQIKTVFIDTAPIIYYIEAHPIFGPLVKMVVDNFQIGNLIAISSVITITEVLPKPIQMGRLVLASKFLEFLKNGENLDIIEISTEIAENAGKLRGKYPTLKGLDAIQISTAIKYHVDAFITNDDKLKQVKELKILVLKDYL